MATYNRAAAFVEYCRGSSLDDIALALAIPMNYLKRWAHEEMWHMLAPMQKQSNALVPANTEGQLQRISENRERNLELATKLRDDLSKQVDLLLKGELVCEKITSKGERVEHNPGIEDRRELAGYAKEVAEMTYRALGDVVLSSKSASAVGESGSQNITIVLPGAVAQPRHEIAYDVEAKIVTVPAPTQRADAEESIVTTPTILSPCREIVCEDQKAPCDSADVIALPPE